MKTPDGAKTDGVRFLRRFRLKSFATLGVAAVVLGLFPLLISLGTSWSYGRAFNVAAAAALSSVVIVFLMKMLFVQPRAGSLLLEAGPYLQRRLFIIIASVSLVLAVLNLNFNQSVSAFIQSQALNPALAAFYALLSLGRLRAYREGIWLYYDLLPWHKIKSYRWICGTLYFETDDLYLWTQTSCVVPEKHVEAFEMYLLEYNIPDSTADLAVAT